MINIWWMQKNAFSVPADRTSKQNLPMLYGPEGSENEVLQGIVTWAGAGKGYHVESGGDDRRRSAVDANNDIKLNLGRGDTMKRLQRMELTRFFSSRRRPTANGLATLICVMTRRQWVVLPQRNNQQQNQAQAEQQ